MTAHVEVRSQKAAGKWPKIGPDKYVAVQLVPQGVEPLTQLRQDIAKKRGIEIVRFGEGYSQHTGPRSMLGKALQEARDYAAKVNA